MRLWACLILALTIVHSQADSNADVVNLSVERTVDLTSSLARIVNLISVENAGKSALKSYTFIVEPSHANNLAFIGANVILNSFFLIAISHRLIFLLSFNSSCPQAKAKARKRPLMLSN